MSKIDINEFRQVLGVGTLYPDTQLQQSCDAADQLIDGKLNYNRAFVDGYEIFNGTVTLYFSSPHAFAVGQSIVVTGVDGAVNGTRTITAVNTYSVNYAMALADQNVRNVNPLGQAILASQVGMYDTVPAVREAALAIAVEIFQQKIAAGGQIQAVDYTPSPHRLGRALLARVDGLLADTKDMGSMVG